jgi:hypothetical protein
MARGRKHTHLPREAGYTFKKTNFTTEEAFADEVRAAVHHIANLMNTGKEKGLTVNFGINTFGEGGLLAPTVEVLKKL